MALVACEECGHQMSDRAVTCPQCGAPGAKAPAAPGRVDDGGPPRVKTASDSVFTRNRGCVDFLFLLPFVVLLLYWITSCTSG